MTLLEIAGVIAADIALAVPASIVGSLDREHIELKATLDATGEELARRVDWSALRNTTTVIGDGTALTHALPAAFLRLIAGLSVTVDGAMVRGGLSAEEFLSLTELAGTPRYFLIKGKTIKFWPFLHNGIVATINYQSSLWNTNGPSAAYVSDTDTALLPDQLMIKGAIARWRRQKGMDYPDYRDEYEQAVQDFATFDDNARSP